MGEEGATLTVGEWLLTEDNRAWSWQTCYYEWGTGGPYLDHGKEIGVFHGLHGSESLLVVVPANQTFSKHCHHSPSLTSATCPGSREPRDLLSVGSHCEQTSPISCESDDRGCLRSEGRVQSDICPDTRTALQSRAPWQSSPTGRSYHAWWRGWWWKIQSVLFTHERTAPSWRS